MGRIVAPFGVRGWVKVQTFTRHAGNLTDYPLWQLGDGDRWNSVRVESARVQGGGLVAKLEAVEDRDAAMALRNSQIAVSRDSFPPAEPGMYYWADLLGLDVVNTQGEHLGQVLRLMETGANDVMVVEGAREHLLPFVADVVREVDLTAGVVRVDWGLDF